MKTRIHPRSIQAMKRSHSIDGLVDHWCFRREEVAAGHFMVEGTDRWGRTVSRSGADPEQLLAECVRMAEAVNAEEANRSS